jgi:hypothetical protein
LDVLDNFSEDEPFVGAVEDNQVSFAERLLDLSKDDLTDLRCGIAIILLDG